MNKFLYALCYAFISFVSIVPRAYAAAPSYDGIRRIMDMFWSFIDAFFGSTFIASQKLGVIRFAFVLVVFSIVHFGLRRVPAFEQNSRPATVIALVFSFFVLLIPESVLLTLANSYAMIIAFLLAFGIVAATWYLAWSFPAQNAINRGMRILFIIIGIIFLIVTREAYDNWVTEAVGGTVEFVGDQTGLY